MALIYLVLVQMYLLTLCPPSRSQSRTVGRLKEVFAWKQIAYDIDGNRVTSDRIQDDTFDTNNVNGPRRGTNKNGAQTYNYQENEQEINPFRNNGNRAQFARRSKRQIQRGQGDEVVFLNNNFESDFRKFQSTSTIRPEASDFINNFNSTVRPDASSFTNNFQTTTTVRPEDEEGRFYVQYNNVPMGAERVGDRLFITVPRRRHGIPATLNYINLTESRNTRSPLLRPYPNLRQTIVSVYRTRADECSRLWMVDTGRLEIPNNNQQIRPPAILVFDLNSDRHILRYQLKSTDLPAENTPTGLASITVDVPNGNCQRAFAYIPDLTTFGIIVYSLQDNDSWRVAHNFFHFNPVAGVLNIAGQRFQWSDGIFSIALTSAGRDSCRTAYFHPLISTTEFSVNTCTLRNRTASNDTAYWSFYSIVGHRGEESQSSMHDYHPGTRVLFFADIARNAVSCWNTANNISPSNIAILGQDGRRLSYPSDLHVTGDEVWVIANSLPRFSYSRLDTNEYNFFIYRTNVQDLITGTVCANSSF